MTNWGRAAGDAGPAHTGNATPAAKPPTTRAPGWRDRGAALLDLVLPEHCAGCGVAGTVCCGACRSVFDGTELVVHASGVHALARHRGLARTLVVAHKEHRRRALARPLGTALAAAVPHLPDARPAADGTWWLVPVPSRPSAARERGGSHLLALARVCASAMSEAGLPVAVAPALRLTRGARDAVGLDRAQRAANLAGRLRVRPRACPPRDAPVVLLDDVVTTGSTLTASRNVLAAAGVPALAALTLTAA